MKSWIGEPSRRRRQRDIGDHGRPCLVRTAYLYLWCQTALLRSFDLPNPARKLQALLAYTQRTPLVPKTTPRDTAQKNAQYYFRKAELQPDTLAKNLQKKERIAGAANTARLRELRLTREAAEKQA